MLPRTQMKLCDASMQSNNSGFHPRLPVDDFCNFVCFGHGLRSTFNRPTNQRSANLWSLKRTLARFCVIMAFSCDVANCVICPNVGQHRELIYKIESHEFSNRTAFKMRHLKGLKNNLNFRLKNNLVTISMPFDKFHSFAAANSKS